MESSSLVEEKGLLSELKMRVKNYKETKEHSYLIYRKELENYRKELIAKINTIVPNEGYYEVSDNSADIYRKCHNSNL